MTTRQLVAPRWARTWIRGGERALSLSTLLVTLAAPAPAQRITIKTVPIAQGDQFEIFPSQNRGMGGVSIARADTLLDPFLNPATGARLRGARFFGSPTFYSVSNEAGGGRTLPIGAFLGFGDWYAGLSVALQEVAASRPNAPGPIVTFDAGRAAVDSLPAPGSDERSHANAFAFALLGRVFPAARLSLAGSVLWTGLNAVDGVDQVYAGSESIRQSGHAVDVRLGMLKEWAGDRSLEAIVLHHRLEMTHDVTYLEWFWDPGTQQSAQRAWSDHNLEGTSTWGLHVEYQRPLAASGWRIGWVATGNRMSHPTIANYEIMNIPRDPGHSYAYNLGIGISRTVGAATFGLDAIYEPIWSNTWAEAAAPVETLRGDTIPAGGKTVENHFRFSNALFRMGVSRGLELRGLGKAAGLQLGLELRSIHYWLGQDDNVQVARRNHEEWWLEWTPTWGLSLHFPEFAVRYVGRVTLGTGRPETQNLVVPRGPLEDRGRLATPSGPLTLDEVSVVMHQVSLSLPLR